MHATVEKKTIQKDMKSILHNNESVLALPRKKIWEYLYQGRRAKCIGYPQQQ